ncbi:MAG TPA: DUF3667 domain-containing protein [Lacibacter sp.]|nr:DUF3667 domain-containing protein [Lacibacter sp.]HMO89100.1 DUF3667 domain-containing protein [Lacibacter sp.]HMP85805.1 DUF3667 domain-containing protein [Lacibacter sp.]
MAHGRLRSEKNCLNCNARVLGPYCHVCGQENREIRESAWDILIHFFNDITHFQGKFISSLRYLLLRPGFLSREYISGRRARYMNPIRMYVFTSAFFFLIFFLLFNPKKLVRNPNPLSGQFETASMQVRDSALAHAATGSDSLAIDSMYRRLFAYARPGSAVSGDSLLRKATNDLSFQFNFGNSRVYPSVAAYDSLQSLLPEAEQDGWLSRFLNRRSILLRGRYGAQPGLFLEALLDKYFHSFPQILFISLPLIALLLWLLFRRQQVLYPQHLIFTIHYFIFAFLWLLVLFAGLTAEEWLQWSGWTFLRNLWWIIFFLYLYKAMRHFYGQSRGKTLLKFFFLLFAGMLMNLLLFVLFFSYTLFNI